MSTGPCLLADIGGTHIRLAWQDAPGQTLHDTQVLLCADHARLEEALAAYLKQVQAPQPKQVALGMANPVTGDQVRMTNHHWTFSQQALAQAWGLERLVVLNDFTALALALPTLQAEHMRAVGGGAPVPGAAIALLGPGTGLGVSGLVPSPLGPVPLAGEGGHATLAAETELEFAVLQRLRQRYGHVSAERAVSGQGLVDLYHAVLEHQGAPGTECLRAAEVTEAALTHQDVHALQALELFCGFLGQVAGNLVLTLGARGGVYIGGGIVPRLGHWFDHSPFRARFEAKGRFQPYLAQVPSWVIDAGPGVALNGVARALTMP